ncbi:MAG: ribosomal protein S18-alanine N-acetyltransferase [Oligoflexia bacterium]|nr:ribosomal protein S18-alanine N-acetyltransferase [Oligoflexia bacterium]
MTKIVNYDTNCELFLVKQVTNEDLPDIFFIETLSFPSPWTLGMFANELESKNSYGLKAVSKGSGKVTGYIFARKLYHELHIMNLAVHPDHRRTGIGSMLLSEFLALNTGMLNVYLEVRISNSSAISLYESFGFRQIYLRNRYYHNGEDAIVMLLEPGTELNK